MLRGQPPRDDRARTVSSSARATRARLWTPCGRSFDAPEAEHPLPSEVRVLEDPLQLAAQEVAVPGDRRPAAQPDEARAAAKRADRPKLSVAQHGADAGAVAGPDALHAPARAQRPGLREAAA